MATSKYLCLPENVLTLISSFIPLETFLNYSVITSKLSCTLNLRYSQLLMAKYPWFNVDDLFEFDISSTRTYGQIVKYYKHFLAGNNYNTNGKSRNYLLRKFIRGELAMVVNIAYPAELLFDLCLITGYGNDNQTIVPMHHFDESNDTKIQFEIINTNLCASLIRPIPREFRLNPANSVLFSSNLDEIKVGSLVEIQYSFDETSTRIFFPWWGGYVHNITKSNGKFLVRCRFAHLSEGSGYEYETVIVGEQNGRTRGLRVVTDEFTTRFYEENLLLMIGREEYEARKLPRPDQTGEFDLPDLSRLTI